MKYVLILLLSLTVQAKQECTNTETVVNQDVVHVVDTATPKHLKGATITITKADGTSFVVKAEDYMVVPRKQKTIVGQNKAVTQKISCNVPTKDTDKNIVSIDFRKDVADTKTEASSDARSSTVKVIAEREVIPGINYFRREVVGDLGFGAGIDKTGSGKVSVGIEF